MAKPKNLIFFQGNTQYENSGDVLINASLVSLFKEHGQFVINDTQMPEDYLSGIGILENERITYYKSGFISFMLKKALGRCFDKSKPKVYLIAGPPGHLFGSSLSKSLRTVISAGALILLKCLGATIIKIGFSVGPIGKSLAMAESFRARFVDYYFVRESLSLELCRKIGIKKARFFPDLAWLYKTPESLRGTHKSKIILSFRNSITLNDKDDAYLKRLKENLLFLLKHLDIANYELEILYQVKMDYQFCQKLYDELHHTFNVKFRTEQVNLENAYDAYSNASFVLTNRLHCALLAYKYGALPTILTSAKDHLKISGIYGDAGISNLILNVNDSPEKNAALLSRIIEEKDEIIGKLDRVSADYENKGRKLIEEIFNSNI